MKNNKGMIILLVALALLTLVVVIGLFFFYPKDVKTAASPATPATPATTVTPLPDQFDPVEWTRNPQPTGLQPPSAPSTTGTQAPGDQSFTVTLPAANQTAAPAPVAFPGEASPAAPPKTVAAPKPVAPKVAVKPVKKVKVTEYWIQVGSFKDRYQAENTAKTLETQGLKGTLTTATVAGQPVVRVRVGPYTNEAEAGKFLAWLKPIKEFESSYVTKAVASRAE